MRIGSIVRAIAKPVVYFVVDNVGRYRGVRYVFDVALDRASVMSKWLPLESTLRQDVEQIEWHYTTVQTHRRRCPECTWMIGRWPFNGTHEYCDKELAHDHNGIAGPHSIAASYCECGSPLTTRMIRRKSHVCELHMENLRPRPMHRLRDLIGV